MDIALIPGLWLDGSSWGAVVPTLERTGHRARPLTLPGMEGRDADRSGNLAARPRRRLPDPRRQRPVERSSSARR